MPGKSCSSAEQHAWISQSYLMLHLLPHLDCLQGANPPLLWDFLLIFWTSTHTCNSPQLLHSLRSCLEIIPISKFPKSNFLFLLFFQQQSLQTFPVCMERLVASPWLTVVVFVHFFLGVGVCWTLPGTEAGKEWEGIGQWVQSGSRVRLCTWYRPWRSSPTAT